MLLKLFVAYNHIILPKVSNKEVTLGLEISTYL